MSDELLSSLGLVAGPWLYFKPIVFDDGSIAWIQMEDDEQIDGPIYTARITAVTHNTITLGDK